MHNATYPYFRFGTWEFCAYCGFPPKNKDHVMPMAFINKVGWRDIVADHIGPQTPACPPCNQVLGAKMFYSFEARCEWVSEKWAKKAARIAARWERPELMELDGALRNYVVLKQIERADLFRRWKWFGSDEYYLNLENLLYEPTLDLESVKYNANYRDYFSSTLAAIASCLDSREARKRCS